MAARTKSAPVDLDPDVQRCERQRDRVASQYDDGTASIEALEAAEGRLSNAIAEAERRAERGAAIARERDRAAKEADEKAARWRAASPAIAEQLLARELVAYRLRMAFDELVESVEEWSRLPPIKPLLTDAPGAISTRKDRDPLPDAFGWSVRRCRAALGLPLAPNPPEAWRQPFDDVVLQLHGAVWAALDDPKAK